MPKNLHSADWTRHNIIIFSNLTVKRIKLETSFTISQPNTKNKKKAPRDKETWFKNVNIGKSTNPFKIINTTTKQSNWKCNRSNKNTVSLMSAKWWPDPMSYDMQPRHACIIPNHNPISGGVFAQRDKTHWKKTDLKASDFCITSSDSFQQDGAGAPSGWTAHTGSRSSTTPWGKHLLATRQLEFCNSWGTIWKNMLPLFVDKTLTYLTDLTY